MALVSLITFFYFSVKYLNKSHQRNFLIVLVAFSIMLSNAQILFLNNSSWILKDNTLNVNLWVISRLRLIFNREQHQKNIFYGLWKDTNVVLKEYSIIEECPDLDNQECLLKYSKYVLFSSNEELKSLAVCPTVEGFQDAIVSYQFGNISFESATESVILNVSKIVNCIQMFLSNSELFKILSSDVNWPIPKSFGVRGNVLIEEYVGPTLSSLDLSDWNKRAKLAFELLKMARIFTFGHERFSFYFTDISPDNIAIRESSDAVLIDLDHVIIVDRLSFGSLKSQHVSETSNQKEDGFMFSTQDICRHPISDLNYYSVCQVIWLISV